MENIEDEKDIIMYMITFFTEDCGGLWTQTIVKMIMLKHGSIIRIRSDLR